MLPERQHLRVNPSAVHVWAYGASDAAEWPSKRFATRDAASPAERGKKAPEALSHHTHLAHHSRRLSAANFTFQHHYNLLRISKSTVISTVDAIDD